MAGMASQQQQQLGQQLFGDLYAAIGWHPQHRRLLQLLSNLTSPGTPGSGFDATALAAALLEASSAAAASSAGGGSSGGSGWLSHGGLSMAPSGLSMAPSPSGGGGGGGRGDDPAGPVAISLLGLFLGALVIGVNGLISVWLHLGLHGKLAVATVRCFAQLSILGYILVPIFTANRWWVTLLYSLFMLSVAAIEAVSRPALTYDGMLLHVLASLGLACSLIITYGLALVVQITPFYDPQYFIPMLGMLLGNACSGVAVGLSTILDELSAGRDKVEMLLAMGATRREASREVVQKAARMALTPLLNTMNVVGIVSIPGMMTGQILGGSNPATAARYQIIIMFLIGTATGLSSVATIFLATHSLLDRKHRLRSERLQPRESSAKGAVAWLGVQASQAWRSTRARAAQLGTRVKLVFSGRREGRGRRPGSGGGVSGGGAGSAAATGYQSLAGSGRGRGMQEGAGDDAEGGSVASYPSRLREVLVAGSVGSSFTEGAGGTSPLASHPLLGREASGQSP